MLLHARGSPTEVLSPEDLRAGLFEALDRLGPRHRVLALPPDYTRVHSQAGLLTEIAWEYYGPRLVDVLPTIGTHYPMTRPEIEKMFGPVPLDLFRVHDWRRGLVTLGTVPATIVREASEGAVDFDIPIQTSPRVAQGSHDLILSIGQVVPHEVIGMAGHSKNVFIGTGGAQAIHRTHYLGAVYGMERIMGRADTPVRRVLSYGSERFARHLPIVYVQTVIGRGAGGQAVVRGLFVGDDEECFLRAAALSREVNVQLLDRPPRKVVVFLDPAEFKSTWLGNKSIYRTRMAIADGGELIVLAPGVAHFGEAPEMDALIRKYGYVGTATVLELVHTAPDLRQNLAAPAHLIHGSSEGRFTITYCPGHLSREEIEGVGFRYGDLSDMLGRYDPGSLVDGPNRTGDGEDFFFVSHPGRGLWAWRQRFASP